MSWTIETYKKRTGTLDHEKEFDSLMCAFYALKLIDCNEVSDFEMYTKHASCGDFDDVAVRVKFIDGSVKLFLLQLKYLENKKNLYLRELEAPKGDFSLSRYQQCHQNINLDEFKKGCEENKFYVHFILYTNKRAAFQNDDKLTLQSEEWQIKESSSDIYPNILNTSEDENCIFTIKNCQTNSCTDFKIFLKSLFIYTNQKNHQSIKKQLGELLNKQLSCNFDEEKFILFFKQWWEGKFVLTKADVIIKLSELVFSPWIEILSNQKDNSRSKLLKEAIMTFDITVVGDIGGDIVETIWDKPICDEKSIAMVNQKFGLSERYVDKLTTENKIFWYIDETPLVIKVNESNKKEIQSAIFLLKQHRIKKKLVLIGDCKEVNLPDDWEIFENLFCLKEKEEHLYQKIIKEFGINFQGNGMVSIENLIGGDEENARFLGVKELFLILNKDQDVYCVEEKKEELPSEYIPRMISAIILEANNILQQSFLKKNLLIINCDHKYNLIEDMIGHRDIEIMKISKFFQLIESKPINQRTIIIIASSEECTMNNFQKICSKITRDVHLIKLINKECFLLLLSHGNQEELKLCSKESMQIDERNIHNVLDAPINFLCAEPGIGKSTTLKYLKNTTPTDFWGVFIELKAHNSFFKTKPSCETILNKPRNKLLDIVTKETDTFPYKIKQILLRRKKIIFFIDGLEEMEHDCINYVIDFIKKITLQGFHVWISSRENLKEKIEKSLNLFSVGIVELNKTQQEDYIRTRLEKNNYKNEEIKQIVNKISNNAYIDNNNKILGIPLQLYIITQILVDNKSYNLKLDDEMFVLTNLYNMFFKGNIKHSLRKKGLEDEDLAERMSTSELERYAIPALKTCLREDHFRFLNLDPLEISEAEKFLLSIKNNCDEYGIIKQINKEGKAVFHHQTYAEYFACIFLSSNFEKVRRLGYSCLNKYHPNLRSMLDLELASANPLHLNIIYNNTEMIEQFIGNSQKDKDRGGRSPLHLICTNLNRYPPLGKYKDSCDEIYTSLIPEMSSLQTITLKLVELYSILEKDELYEWNVIEYALECGCFFLIEAVLTKQTEHSDKVLSLFSEIHDDFALLLAYYSTKYDYPNLLDVVLTKTKKCIDRVDYGERKKSLLHVAAEAHHENLKITELLFQHNFEANKKDSDERTALYYALLEGKIDLAKLLIRNGADINCIDKYGNFVLHEAYSRKDYDLMEHLLDLNIDPDVENRLKQTVLFLAAQVNNAEIVKLLVNKGADVNRKAQNGRTILHIICLYGFYDLVEYLLNHNIDPNIKDNYGITALLFVHDLETVKLLINKGADINSKKDDGQNILFSACVRGNCDVAEYLLNLKMDPNMKDQNGMTPLYYAAYYEWYDLAKLLIGREANVNSIANNGRTPLHEVCVKGNYELTDHLIRRNADLNIKDKDGITALHYALIKGHKFVVKLFINRDVDIKCVTNSGQTLLHAACIGGIYEYVDYLLNHNVDPNIKDNNGETALDLAIYHENEGIIKLLIEKGADIHSVIKNVLTLLKRNHVLDEYFLNHNIDPNSKDKNGRTPVYFAAYYGNYDILKFLICKGGDINTEVDDGGILLHKNCILRNYDLMEFIINQGLEINIKDKYGRNALYYAVVNEISDVVKLLIKGGADINTVTDSGDTLLHEACKKGNCEIIKCLLDYGIDPNIKNNNGATALYVSVSRQMIDVVKLLINKGSDINSVNYDGRTILHEACRLKKHEIIDYLLDHSIDPNIKDKYGNTALHYAVRDKKVNVIELLINKGADINCRQKNGTTVLHTVCSFAHYRYNLIEYLLKNNIDPNIKDNYEQTALHLAVVRQKLDIVKLLIQNGADINSVAKNGSTVLHIACSLRNHNNDLIEYLLNENVDLNMKDKNGQTPLHLVVFRRKIDVLNLLITKADVDSVDAAGWTVLNKVCSLNWIELIIYLLKYTICNPNIKNDDGKTAIYYTVINRNLQATKLLISRGADVSFITNDGHSLLDIALENNNKEMVDLLVESGLKQEKASFHDQ